MYGIMTKKAGETMQTILLVEDDQRIVENLTEYLEGEGFQVRSAAGQTQALERLEGERFDLVLLDISLSDGNGFAVCSAIKALYRLPVIFLTASGDEYSTVTGFEVGADDYVPKPFRPRELLMRIKNVLRRTGSGGGIVRLGRVEVDTVRGRATKDGRDVNLSALEYRLLLMFLNHPVAVLTRNQLLEGIWDVAGDFVSDNTLTVYIKRLREKIEDDPQSPTLIKTVRGLGYQAEMG